MSNQGNELMEAIQKLSNIILKANGDWQPDFTKDNAKCVIAYDHFKKELTYTAHTIDEPLSFLPVCSIPAFYIVKEKAPKDVIETIWVKIYESVGEADDE